MGNSLSDWEVSRLSEESFEYVLRHRFGVDFLGQDNQMDFKEYLRWDNAAQTLIWSLIIKKTALGVNKLDHEKFLAIKNPK